MQCVIISKTVKRKEEEEEEEIEIEKFDMNTLINTERYRVIVSVRVGVCPDYFPQGFVHFL